MRDRNTNCNAMRPTKYQVISSVALPFASVIFGCVLNEGYHPHAMQALGGRTFLWDPQFTDRAHGFGPLMFTKNEISLGRTSGERWKKGVKRT
jgi:hypothetical protein